jgi:hypothetical protein
VGFVWMVGYCSLTGFQIKEGLPVIHPLSAMNINKAASFLLQAVG